MQKRCVLKPIELSEELVANILCAMKPSELSRELTAEKPPKLCEDQLKVTNCLRN
jgi:hypothetical protein